MKLLRILLLAGLAASLPARADDPTPTPTPEPYSCSLGAVTGVADGSYLIATPDGRTIGIAAASGAPSAANVEADISAATASDALASAKAAKRAEIDAAYAAVINGGATIGGVTYGVTEADQANWLAALTALNNYQTVMSDAGTPIDPATLDATTLLGPLLNQAGEPVGTVTVTAFRALMAQLTAQIGSLRAAYVGALQALAAATTPAEAEAVSLATPTPTP